MARFSLLFAALSSAGCGLLLATDPQLDAEDGGDGAITDANAFDAPARDTIAPLWDGAPTDGPPPADAFVDAGIGCLSPVPAEDVVAHYTFDADPVSRIVDERGAHDGSTENGVIHVEGRCGLALAFPTPAVDGIAHAHIRDHDDFDIPEGSLELYARVAGPGPYGIISRDERGVPEPGHFGIFTSYEGHVIVRMQDVPGGHGDNAVWLCSNRPMRVGEWEHIGVSWGGDRDVQLWLDGELATITDDLVVTWDTGGGSRGVPCGTTVREHGIDGNSLSWILGANSNLRSADQPYRLEVPFTDGAIDELRILDVRQDYGRP